MGGAGIDLSIIVVNWNTREMLRECLTSVEDHWRSVGHEIIVVDNASVDGSADMVADLFPNVRLIRNAENVGFVKANNQAVPQARGRYLLLLNSDTRVLDGGVGSILEYMDRHPEVGAATGRVLNKDGSFQRPFRRFPRPLGAYLRHTTRLIYGFDTPLHHRYLMTDTPDDAPCTVDWVTGAYLFVRKSLAEGDRVFDEDIFMYYEDTMLCYCVRERGSQVMYLPMAPIIHYGGASAKQVRARSAFLSFQGSEVYFAKTRGPLVAGIYRISVRTTWAVFAGVFALVRIVPIRKLTEKSVLFRDLLRFSGSSVVHAP